MQNQVEPILFVYNVHYQGREEMGPTSSWELTWRSSIESFFGNGVYFFNPDTYGPESNSESDFALLQLVEVLSPALIIMIYHNGTRWSRDFISIETLEKIYNKSKIVSIWGDIQLPAQRALLKKLAPFIHLNLCTASSAAVSRLGMGTRVRYVPVPILDLKSNTICNCDNLISFAGGVKDNREVVIKFLKKNGVGIHLGGGEGSGTLSRTQFMSLLGHKMTLSFGGPSIVSLTNARTFEALSQETMLLEKWGSETCKLLVPFVEYVPWFSKRDLLQKILFYKENLLEVSKISALGNQKLRNYSNELLWEAILAKIFDNQDFQFIANNNLNLVGVPFRFRFQARLLNYISSEPRFEKYFTLSHFINRGVSATINFFKRVVRKTMSLSLELRN